jgi:hypothetical protein
MIRRNESGEIVAGFVATAWQTKINGLENSQSLDGSRQSNLLGEAKFFAVAREGEAQ